MRIARLSDMIDGHVFAVAVGCVGIVALQRSGHFESWLQHRGQELHSEEVSDGLHDTGFHETIGHEDICGSMAERVGACCL